MHPIAVRFVLIVSMLMSFQASAGMFMEPSAKGKCADMDMTMSMDTGSKTQSSDKSVPNHNCDSSCCMAFTAISTSAVVPVVKVAADFQKTATQSPSRFTYTNFRPPILS